MDIKVSIKAEIVSFDSFHFQAWPPKEEDDEIKELEKRLGSPYELPEDTAALRGPVSIWGASG